MNDFIAVKTKPCCVCDKYEVWSLDRNAVTRWQEGENIQSAFPDMSAGDREILISGTHAACWRNRIRIYILQSCEVSKR